MAATRRKVAEPQLRARRTVTTRLWRHGRWWLAGLTAAAVAVVAVFVISGRGGGRDEGQQVATDGSVQAPGQAPAVHLAVPDIRLTAAGFTGGQQFVLAENAHKPTIVYAMASWCISCVPESRALVQLHRELGDQVNIVVLDIDPGDNEEMLQQFSKAAGGAPGVWALDKGSAVTKAYNIRSLDTTIVVAGGREVSRTIGPQSLDQLRAAVAKAQQAVQ